MAGSIELVAQDGGELRLTEAPIPGKGKPAALVARNTGTTVVHTVSIIVEGEGADHVELSVDGQEWSSTELELDPIKPGGEEPFFVRSTYSVDDAEDRLDFELVASAISVG